MRPHVDESGKSNDKTIIMIHGAGGSTNTWFMQKRGLAKSLHTIAIDLNGHGLTPNRQTSSIQAYIREVGEIVKKQKSPFLMGHSMGGAITQLFALEHPDSLSGIILVGTGAKLRVSSMVFDLLDNDFDGYLKALREYMFHEAASENMIRTAVQEAKKCPVSVIRRDFEFCDNFDIMTMISEIELPTLIIVGADDVMTPPKYARYLHNNIKGSELRIIERAGHSVMVEQSRVFNETVLDWIEGITLS